MGSGSDCNTQELMNMINNKSCDSSSMNSGRKLLRPIMPRPLNIPISTAPLPLISPSSSPLTPYPPSSNCTCFLNHKANILSTAPIQDQSKQETNTVTSSRWAPTAEQLGALETMYEGGTRTPTADEIKLIAAKLRRFGKIEGKNVFYWFQNHKARERQKRRRDAHHRGSLESEEPGFEAGQAKNNATSNCSTISEDSVSIHRAVVASKSRAQGWIQLEETESLQQTRRRARITQSKHAMWQPLKQPFSSPQAFQLMPPKRTAPEKALNLSMKLAPNCRDMKDIEFEEEGGNTQTLQLFPIRTRDWSAEESDYKVSVASINTTFVPNRFFEFLPMKN